LSLTQGLLRAEAHDGHGVHGLGEVICVTLARDGDGAPAQEAVLVGVAQQQVGWGEERSGEATNQVREHGLLGAGLDGNIQETQV